MAKGRGKDKSSIIIRKEEIIEAGHHGGAWKVAYADFVTAMMAFFLLMWLLNATTEDQRRGLADYFSPKNPISRGSSGTGAPFGGQTPYDHGSLTSDRGAVEALVGHAPPEDDPEEQSDTPTELRPRNQDDSSTTAPAGTESGTASPMEATEPMHGRPEQTPGKETDKPGNVATGSVDQQAQGGPLPAQPSAQASAQQAAQQAAAQNAAAAAAQAVPPLPSPDAQQAANSAEAERAAFRHAADQIREAVRTDPNLADLGRQLAIDITPDGLRIQIMDEEKQPMFATGSAILNDRARALLTKVAPVLLHLSEPISLAGHTDATPYHGTDKTNWELSADRANATRRLLVDAGLPETRLRSVTGDADRDPLLPADPFAAANRRIAIMVLRTAPPPPTAATRNASQSGAAGAARPTAPGKS